MRKRIFDVNVQGGFGRSPALVITGGQSGWGDGQNFSSGDVWLRERRGATFSRPGPPRRPAREVLSSHETNGYKTLFLLGESQSPHAKPNASLQSSEIDFSWLAPALQRR